MSLNNATADALAQTIVTNLGAASSALPQWQTICRAFFSSITTNGVVIIPPVAIVTNGTATTQSGPPAPVNLSIS